MPAELTPRQNRHASTPANRSAIAEKSEKSAWTTSTSLGSRVPPGARTTEITWSTSAARRHSRSTPWPTIPLAPNNRTFTPPARYHASVRIVAGSLGGRVLRAPHGAATRPTSEKVREALFAIIGDPTGAVLDLFAGSGALGIEALSRGATHATFVDSGKTALAALRGNLAT